MEEDTWSKKKVYGIDFSGAKDAPKKIWISEGAITGHRLRIENCWKLADLTAAGTDRDQVFRFLMEFIKGKDHAAFGFDFPFGLPMVLVKDNNWATFIMRFSHYYRSPEHFYRVCHEVTNGLEVKRLTDGVAKAPLCPYNIRLYRQTYFGIQEILYPLVRDKIACVLPMQRPLKAKPWILEVCPASTLKSESLYCRYKGSSDSDMIARKMILEKIITKGIKVDLSAEIRNIAIGDTHGDALDSIIAAIATCRALHTLYEIKDPSKREVYMREGFIYI
ncbi:MAG: hypothetical protein J7L53_02165 [Deltaproteobacteria bacterium]|nr:hypothetical protein [Deltaproteobacteria bacterium]